MIQSITLGVEHHDAPFQVLAHLRFNRADPIGVEVADHIFRLIVGPAARPLRHDRREPAALAAAPVQRDALHLRPRSRALVPELLIDLEQPKIGARVGFVCV